MRNTEGDEANDKPVGFLDKKNKREEINLLALACPQGLEP